jgi:uncharacterized Zn finger protein
MSWDERFPRFERATKKPPPNDGIKVKKTGTTWWGLRWIEALSVVLSSDAKRLARGRTYARAGRTHDLVVTGGKASAKVTGSRAAPYDVSIQLKELPHTVWATAITMMAGKAQFSAELLAGQMPRDVDDVFKQSGASLFPAQRSDLVTSCTCPDWGDPCKHVAATHYVLGEALDRDPFLLFELRGRAKGEVLAALRAARGTTSAGTPAPETETVIPKVTLGTLEPARYDSPREVLPSLHLSFDEPVSHGALLRQLGAPPGWSVGSSPAELLLPLVQAAAEKARRIALADAAPETPGDADGPLPDAPAKRPRAPAKTKTSAGKAVAKPAPGKTHRQKVGKKSRGRRP